MGHDLMDVTINLQKTDCITQLHELAHDHTKKIEIALRIIEGIGVSFLLLACVMQAHVALAIAAGISVVMCVEISLFALDLLGVIRVDPKEHAFTPGSINNSCLYYEGDLPVLKIRADTHYQAGFDHGYLIAHQITAVVRRLNILVKLGHVSLTKELTTKLQQVKSSIPEHHMEELKGLVEGGNQRLKEDSWCPDEYTIDDAIMLHMLPDLMHLALAPNCLFGCTVVVGKDEQSGITGVGRNLDWPGLGVGRLTLLQDIKVGDEEQLLMPTIPGCVGTITGLSREIFVSINVTEPKKRINDVTKGVPSLFLNRLVLENAHSVKEAEEFIDHSDAARRPAVPYHMFVADRKGGSFHHFLQGDRGETHIRPMGRGDKPHFTLNCRHPDSKRPTTPNTLYYGETRFNNIERIWKEGKELPLVERLKRAMRAPGVNNPMTVHSILWMDDILVMSFDNAYAAKGQKCFIPLNQQFEK